MNMNIDFLNDLETNYFSPPEGHASRAYHVPIHYRDMILAAYKAAGIKVRLRYRGSRKQSVGRVMRVEVRDKVYTWKRNRYQAQSYCLKEDAKTFSVYTRK